MAPVVINHVILANKVDLNYSLKSVGAITIDAKFI